MGVLAVNRYINICRNDHYKKIFTLRNSYFICFLCWIGGLLIDFTNQWGWGGHGYDLKTANCIWNRMASLTHTLLAIVGIITPCILILLCYLKVFHYVYKQRAISSVSGSNNNSKSVKIAISLFVPFLLFAICW
jgi:hypothetical protein